ncbi:glycoside hydrolase family 26 protein [Marinisporobacter balticus]|uniref:Glycosyl hydrolase family 26 n=1 Tax=Marinisporobacter balticus TaxID=2018667 RepID=A0A4R2KKR3_9FIRM|nr:glycosyl hydrolase [Marinisporobacter balticus]TCO73152.1 glycosyl hydrolase family 26 [Marinisporobacter balticus]
MKNIGIILCIASICFSSIFAYGDALNPYIEKDNNQIQLVDQQYNEYINYADGYKINYPKHMGIDSSLSTVKTIIADEERKIEIYYDDFRDTQHSSIAYSNYSNAFIRNRKDHIKQYENTIFVNGMKTHLLVWSRKKLEKVKNDKNYYVSAEIMKNNNEVYTIFIKSETPFKNYEDYMDVINSFQLIERSETAQINTKFKSVEKNLNEETRDFYEQYFLKSDHLKWGIFEQSAPEEFWYLNALESKLDYTFEFLVRYQSLDVPFPMEEMINAYKKNRYVELTLQTMHMGQDNASITYDILDGKYDDYFNEYVKKIKEFEHPILFRLNNEMNGDWCVYSSYYTSKDTELYNELWRYLYNKFEENGVDNVLWVWNPHDLSFPNFKWNHYLNYYPGDQYVDIIGLTGYNTGNYYKGEIWRDFDEIYPVLYDEYMSIFEQPFMITEFGSNSVGGDKIKWVNDMFDRFEQNPFSNIKVAIWWNGIDWDPNQNPARIYRLDRNEEMINTFRERLKFFNKEKEEGIENGTI